MLSTSSDHFAVESQIFGRIHYHLTHGEDHSGRQSQNETKPIHTRQGATEKRAKQTWDD